MFLIDTTRNGKPLYDPLVNQSLDNYLLQTKRLQGHGLIIYINHPAVIIGVHQNAYAEVDLPYLRAHQIDLVRRSSGGGAVYQDYGNIIFENIVVNDPTAQVDNYQAIGAPILSALHDLGVPQAQLSGRNDLVIDGQKFCGMTMVKTGDSYAAGGTIMFDLNQEQARQVLTPNQEKLQSKGVKSVDKRITNIKPYLSSQYRNWTGEDFKNYLLCHMFGVDKIEQIETYHLTDDDWQNIDDALAAKYTTEEWNYGKNPGYHDYVSHHFDIGTVAFNYTVTNNQITHCQIYGDFITKGDVEVIDRNLLGVKYDYDSLVEALQQSDLEHNLGKITPEAVANLILKKYE